MKFINSENLNFEFNKEPFPYVVIDNFINQEYLVPLLDNMNQLTKDNSYYYGDQKIEKNKYAFKENFKETLSELFKELNISFQEFQNKLYLSFININLIIFL